jgi:hypothetical protein
MMHSILPAYPQKNKKNLASRSGHSEIILTTGAADSARWLISLINDRTLN